ncbi:arginine deiminase [Roseimarinus sediminis]|uniref:arginine deiminase n=1 Tax=Roseimarinus sediminis TaxID=1610899 RepID=UPI003D1E7523
MQNVAINSEIGVLEGVVLHTPGQEVEKMTPENAERALYSDILNLSVAHEEYRQFKGVLQKHCTTYEVKELLSDILDDEKVKNKLLEQVCNSEGVPELKHELTRLDKGEAARQLIEGVELIRDNLTKYLSIERYSLRPLHNFLFTRDASMSIYNKVLIGKMASNVRDRESVIMEAIFNNHPHFGVETVNASRLSSQQALDTIRIEGGDVLIARDDVLVIGTGIRTSTQGIDFLIEAIKTEKKEIQHIIVQELPETPESFIHLDMVFTLLDRDACMVYEPLFLMHNRFRTIHITISNGKVVSIKNEPGLLSALKSLKFDLKPIKCGGDDAWHQEREQWHSGANFFAIAPGVVMGYERNNYTVEELNKNGFDVIKAKDIIEKNLPIPTKKTIITIAGAELARGGGGARCMSMPVRRKKVDW